MKYSAVLFLAGVSAIKYEQTPSYFYLDLDDDFDEEIEDQDYEDAEIDAAMNVQLGNTWDEKKLATDEEDEIQFTEYGSGDLWEFSTLQLNNRILIDAQNRVQAREWDDDAEHAELPDLGYDEDEDFQRGEYSEEDIHRLI